MAWNDDNKRHGVGNKNQQDDFAALEEKWRELQARFQPYFASLKQRLSWKKMVGYSLGTLFFAWLISGIYIVDQGNRGVVTRFGAYANTELPGPHWHWPYPLEKVAIVNVENQRFIEIGYRSSNRSMTASQSVLQEALMLTEDENIVNVSLAVQYQIKNAKDYLFNVKSSEETLKQVTESIQRGVIGQNSMDYILTEGRSQLVFEMKDKIQEAMDSYGAGLQITSVNLQDAQPPEEVQNSFEDAIRAREDKQRLINESQAYANEVIPKARGASARLINEAESYEAKVVERAKGEAERFDQLLVEYERAPEITRKRLYLESKEKLYSGSNKVLVNVENGSNMFYLPLNSVPQTVNNQNSNNQQMANNRNVNQAGNYKKLLNTRDGIRSSRSQR